jgi:hypothetical protein
MKLTKTFLIAFGIGLVVVGILILGTLVTTKSTHLSVVGKVMKVRPLSADEQNTIVVVDFRARNEAEIPFMSREAKVIITKADGSQVEGDTIAKSDMDRVFDYYKILGPKYNPVLIQRDRIKGREQMDRMVAATVALPEADVEKRKNLTVRLFDVDGQTFDIKEN